MVCDGVCRLLDWDHNNCGTCGNVCGPDTVCDGGVCTECPPGLTVCTDLGSGYAYCADLMSDWQSCGACGNYCDPAPYDGW